MNRSPQAFALASVLLFAQLAEGAPSAKPNSAAAAAPATQAARSRKELLEEWGKVLETDTDWVKVAQAKALDVVRADPQITPDARAKIAESLAAPITPKNIVGALNAELFDKTCTTEELQAIIDFTRSSAAKRITESVARRDDVVDAFLMREISQSYKTITGHEAPSAAAVVAAKATPLPVPAPSASPTRKRKSLVVPSWFTRMIWTLFPETTKYDGDPQ